MRAEAPALWWKSNVSSKNWGYVLAVVRAAPEELAEQLGLKLASELIPDRPVRTSGVVVASPAYSVTEDVAPLLPQAALSGQVAIPQARGATSLLWRLLAGPSTAGRYCAIVGPGQLYPLAATAAGVALEKVVFVDVVGPEQTLAALGALCEGVPVVVASTAGLTPRQVQRAASRARRSGTVLVWREAAVPVAGVDARLEVAACWWTGLRPNLGRRWGSGRLSACGITVAATWRGRDRVRRAELWPYGGGDADGAEVVAFPGAASRQRLVG